MPIECSHVEERLLDLLEPVPPGEAEDPDLVLLRQHATACPHCQGRLEAIQTLLDLGKSILSRSPALTEGPEVEAALQAGETRLLAHLRDNRAQQATDPPAPLSATALARADGLASAVRRRSIAFPPFQVPHLSALAAADAGEPAAELRDRWIRVSDEADQALVEIQLSGAGNRLFISLHDPELQAAGVVVTLIASREQRISERLVLTGGAAEWRLPAGWPPEGACAVEVALTRPGEE